MFRLAIPHRNANQTFLLCGVENSQQLRKWLVSEMSRRVRVWSEKTTMSRHSVAKTIYKTICIVYKSIDTTTRPSSSAKLAAMLFILSDCWQVDLQRVFQGKLFFQGQLFQVPEHALWLLASVAVIFNRILLRKSKGNVGPPKREHSGSSRAWARTRGDVPVCLVRCTYTPRRSWRTPGRGASAAHTHFLACIQTNFAFWCLKSEGDSHEDVKVREAPIVEWLFPKPSFQKGTDMWVASSSMGKGVLIGPRGWTCEDRKARRHCGRVSLLVNMHPCR